jgi:hypothetical protein
MNARYSLATCLAFLAALLSLHVPSLARAESPSFFQGAVGTSFGFVNRRDYGEGDSRRFFLEPAFHAYLALPVDGLFGRGTFHFSYVWQQPEMPQSLRVKEQDLYAGLGMGLVYDWYVIPAVTVGMQFARRDIKIETSAPIQSNGSRISETENLMGYYTQLGVGIPLLHGVMVFEPFYRLRFFPEDEREGAAYGIDVSVQLF